MNRLPRQARHGFEIFRILALAAWGPTLLGQTPPSTPPPDALLLKDYRPRSIFRVPQTRIEKARFPVIDVHSHAYARTDAEVDAWVRTMDAVGLERTIIMTGSTGAKFDQALVRYGRHPGRFEVWCGIDYTGFDQPGFGPAAINELRRCQQAGAAGVGELSDKGGGLRGNSGGMHLDDPRMDAILEECAGLRLPVNVHVGEDRWMYEPMDETNDGLMNSFQWRIPLTPGILGHDAILATLENAVKKHPRLTFIACHFANCCYDLGKLGALLDRYPNLYADIGARFGETAPIPRFVARFYGRYQDRLLYGTDMGADAEMYRTTFRILETEDEHFYDRNLFSYHWPLHGFGLGDEVLRRVYRENALAILDGTHVMNGSRTNAEEAPPKPPIAKRVPKTTQIHGYTVTDDYAWLADKTKTDKDMLAYLRAETGYADAMMAGTQGFQDALYQEMLARIQETDEDVPYREGDYFYYSRTEQGKQYPIFCRKRGNLTAPEAVTIDMNEMAKDLDYFSLGVYQVSDDGNLLAFSTDTNGFRQYALFVKDLRTGSISGPLAERVTSVAWANDNKTLIYGQEDERTKRSNKIFRHTLGGAQPSLIYEEKDELYRTSSARTRSKDYIVVTSASSTTSEARYVSAARPDEALKLFLPRRENHEYYLDHLGGDFYIRTNDKGKNFRLATVPVDDPRPDHWKEIIPHRQDVMLEDVDCFATHFVAVERENGVPRLSVFDLKSGTSHPIEFPEPVYVVSPTQNAEFHTTTYRIAYQSFITPSSVFDYDVKTRQRELKKQQPVLGGYDGKLYRSERIYATAADGVKIPISLVYRRELERNGRRPMLLQAYGSYGAPSDVNFSSGRLSLLDRGVICVIAHIRGGGDLGKDWHDQGKMMTKRNTFTDFIAAAEHLVREKYTSSDRLVITGGSAGGLLMGAVTNLRPDLFRAVVSYVPFVDVMNTMLDASLPLTVGEYLEWGNPNEKPAYDYMRSYSPYDNIEKKAYPTILIRTSLNDSQVMYWEPAKYVARLRAMKTDQNLLLLKVKLEPGGHGGASGRYDRLKDTAFDYAFILGQFGIVN